MCHAFAPSPKFNNATLRASVDNAMPLPRTTEPVALHGGCKTRRVVVAVPSQKPPANNRRCVSFAPLVLVRYTISRKDYKQEEEQATWYTEEERQEMSRRRQKEVKLLNRGEILLDKKYSSRGLEGLTKIGAMTRTLNKRLAREQVFSAQYYYYKHYGGLCPAGHETIATIAQHVTASSQLWAQVVGLQDRRFVERNIEGGKRDALQQQQQQSTTTAGKMLNRTQDDPKRSIRSAMYGTNGEGAKNHW